MVFKRACTASLPHDFRELLQKETHLRFVTFREEIKTEICPFILYRVQGLQLQASNYSFLFPYNSMRKGTRQDSLQNRVLLLHVFNHVIFVIFYNINKSFYRSTAGKICKGFHRSQTQFRFTFFQFMT